MSLALAIWMVRLAALWLAVGLVVAIPFVVRGAARVDAGARAATWGFRLIILPGATLLWPWVLWRWMRAR